MESHKMFRHFRRHKINMNINKCIHYMDLKGIHTVQQAWEKYSNAHHLSEEREIFFEMYVCLRDYAEEIKKRRIQ